jgi:hypothetical protein
MEYIMKTLSSLNLLFAAAVFFSLMLTPLLSYTAGKDNIKEKDEITLLKERIDALEKTVKNQEKQITALGEKLAKLKNPLLALPKDMNPNRMPKGSKPFNFNGQEYYMVPLDSKPNEKTIK